MFHKLVLKYAPWSISKYQKLDKCGREFYFTYVDRKEAAPSGVEARVGDVVHGVLEDCLNEFRASDDATFEKHAEKRNLTTPEILLAREFLPAVDRFVPRIRRFEETKKIKERGVEAKFAIREDFSPCDYDAKDALLRSKLDYFAITENGEAVIGDHKTGKVKALADHLLQLNAYELVVAAKYPWVKSVQCFIHYVGREDLDWTGVTPIHTVSTVKRKWLVTTLNRHVRRLELMTDVPPPNTSPLCGWCGLRDYCPEGRAEAEKYAEKRAQRDAKRRDTSL